MKYTLFLTWLFLSTRVNSQSVTGMVKENDKPLSLVNISLLIAKDSVLFKTTVTDNMGYYKIENIDTGTYILKASRVGYRQYFLSVITIENNDTHLELPLLMLQPEERQLKEVTVSGKRPFIEQKIDRMIVNVANTIVATGGNVLDLLEKAPGITIDLQSEQIIFRGKEGVIIQIDGKQTYLSMADAMILLRNMAADNVDRIELITNPSAKYDAAGNSGIIDIRLKKNNNIGTNGSVSLSVGTGRYRRENVNLQLNYRTQKVYIFGNFSPSKDGNYFDAHAARRIQDPSELNYVNLNSYIRVRNHGENAKAGLDFFINKKLTIGLVWTGSWNNNSETSPAEGSFRRQKYGSIYLQTLTNKTLSNIQSNQLFNLNIVQVVKGKGQLSADLDIGRFRRKFNNYLITDTIIPGGAGGTVNNLLSYMPTIIDIQSFKVDYSKAIATNWKMEAGIKASSVQSDNDMQLSRGTNGNLMLDTVYTNHFIYKEKVAAAFLSFSGKIDKKTDVILGVRAEHTNSIANAINQKSKITKRYLNIFPSAFITRILNENNSLTVSYSYRIDRPNYQLLNPSRAYGDAYSFNIGNPFLLPQFTHSLEIKHGYKNKLFTAIGASFINAYVYYVIQPVEVKSTQRMPENVGTAQAYNITMSFPIKIRKGWTMQNSLLGIYNRYQYRYKDLHLHSAQISGRFNTAHSILFGKGWTGELAGRIASPSLNAMARNPWFGTMDLGVQKVFTRKWKARLSLQDVFHTNITRAYTNLPDYEVRVKFVRDTRVAMLNITYSFGNQQLKSNRLRKTASEDEILRTN